MFKNKSILITDETRSKDSIIPFFLKLNKKNKKLPLTDVRMRRFNISLENSIELVVKCLKKHWWGNLSSKNSKFLYQRFDWRYVKKNNFKIVGIRTDKKIYEELIII